MFLLSKVLIDVVYLIPFAATGRGCRGMTTLFRGITILLGLGILT